MRPSAIITEFDAFLTARRLRLEAIVIGGAALGLLGVIARQTKDCDILHPELPAGIVAASRAFANEVRKRGEALQDDWLNNGPASLVACLPDGWQDRLQPAFSGSAIVFRTLGRSDLLKTKLFALCDRGLDIGDCIALRPSQDELNEAISWVADQDSNPDWPGHVRATFDDLRRRLDHGL